MNAYELADELQELDSKLHLINLFKSANMLRQQADRIAELEKGAEPVMWINKLKEIPFDGYQICVAPVKDDDYNIPLYTTPQTKETYFCKTCNRHLEVEDGVVIHDDIVHDENEVFGVQEQKPIAYIDHVSDKPKLIGGYVVSTPYDIPLYTTPQTKPLSDEEIKEIASNLTCTADKNWNVVFARAIEAKVRGK